MKKVEIFIEETAKIYILSIGQNQQENDSVVRYAHPDDLWFHLDGNISSPHFVLSTKGDDIPKRYINMIAGMFIQYKKGLGRRYSVIYTRIKNVKLTSIEGTVIPRNIKIVKI